jgi:hypothetical protein
MLRELNPESYFSPRGSDRSTPFISCSKSGVFRFNKAARKLLSIRRKGDKFGLAVDDEGNYYVSSVGKWKVRTNNSSHMTNYYFYYPAISDDIKSKIPSKSSSYRLYIDTEERTDEGYFKLVPKPYKGKTT